MEPAEFILLGIALALGFMLYRLAVGNDWHWGFGVLLALFPLGFTLFLGIYGLLISAVFVGGVYKASAG
jgi:hypothetical protein